MLTVHARIQQVPPDHRGTYDLDTREVSAQADTYVQGLADAEEQTPEGWRVIAIRVDRP